MKKIKLTQGEYAIVDDEDYEYLNQYSWQYRKNKNRNAGYAIKSIFKNGKWTTQGMHRLILGVNDSKIQIDHINGDGLDNRKSNLRICSNTENQWNCGIRKDNLSGYKGVGYYKPNKKYRARIKVDGKQIHVGYFDCKKKAAIAYNGAAEKYHGEFARLNRV